MELAFLIVFTSVENPSRKKSNFCNSPEAQLYLQKASKYKVELLAFPKFEFLSPTSFEIFLTSIVDAILW